MESVSGQRNNMIILYIKNWPGDSKNHGINPAYLSTKTKIVDFIHYIKR